MMPRKDKNIITPHKIAVMLLIEKYGRFRPKYWEPRQHDVVERLFHQTFSPKERKAACFLITKLIEESEMKLSELIQLLENASISPHLLTSYKSGLRELYYNGIDSLLTLFESIEKFVMVLDQNRTENFPYLWSSVVGLHLRQMNLTFSRLSFSQETSIYQKFRLYYEKYYSSLNVDQQDKGDKQEMETEEKLDNIQVEQDENQESLDMTVCSTEVMELTTPQSSNNLLPPLPDIPLLPKNETDVNEDTDCSSGDYLQMLEMFIAKQTSLLNYNESAAMPPPQMQQNIRQLLKHNSDLSQAHFLSYLNCIRVKELAGAVHNLVLSYDSHIVPNDQNGQEDSGCSFKYAALNMAALHAQFGHKKTSLMLLQEAIRLAQESNDHICLQHALTWLYTLSPSHKSQLIKRSLVKSDQLSLNYLNWLGLLNHTMLMAKTSITPACLIKNVLSSNSSTGGNNRAWGQTGLYSVLAGVWTSWGCVAMAGLCSQMVLHICPALPYVPDATYATSSTCTSICNIAMALANAGDYLEASEVLHHAKEIFPPSNNHSKYWMFSEAHIKLTEFLYQGCWVQAETVINSIAASYPLQAQYRSCMLATCKGESTTALKSIQYLLDNKELDDEPELYTQCLLVKAEALITGGNCGAALSVLVHAHSIAQSCHLAYLAGLIKLHLAAVQLELGLIDEARASLSQGLDVVLVGGGVYDQARGKLLAIKLQVRTTKDETRSKELSSAASKLKDVRNLFSKVKAYYRMRDTLYLEARLYHETSCIEERNRCAFEFRQFEQQHPCQSFHPCNYVF